MLLFLGGQAQLLYAPHPIAFAVLTLLAVLIAMGGITFLAALVSCFQIAYVQLLVSSEEPLLAALTIVLCLALVLTGAGEYSVDGQFASQRRSVIPSA